MKKRMKKIVALLCVFGVTVLAPVWANGLDVQTALGAPVARPLPQAQLPAGFVLVEDDVRGYTLGVPRGWAPLDVRSAQFQNMLNTFGLGDQVASLNEFLDSPEGDNLGIIYSADLINVMFGGLPSLLNVSVIPGTAGVTQDALLEFLQDTLDANLASVGDATVEELEAITVNELDGAKGAAQVGLAEFGVNARLYVEVVGLIANDKIYVLTLATQESNMAAYMPIFAQVIDTFQVPGYEPPAPEPIEEPTPEPTEEPVATPEAEEEATPEPTEEPAEEPVEEATPEPAEETVEEPAPEPEVTIPGNFMAITDDTRGYSLAVPPEWREMDLRGEQVAALANIVGAGELWGNVQSVLTSDMGQGVGTFAITDIANTMFGGLPTVLGVAVVDAPGFTPEAIVAALNDMQQMYAANMSDIEITELDTATINNVPGVQGTGTVDMKMVGVDAGAYIKAVGLVANDKVYILALATQDSNVESYEATFAQIIGSFRPE